MRRRSLFVRIGAAVGLATLATTQVANKATGKSWLYFDWEQDESALSYVKRLGDRPHALSDYVPFQKTDAYPWWQDATSFKKFYVIEHRDAGLGFREAGMYGVNATTGMYWSAHAAPVIWTAGERADHMVLSSMAQRVSVWDGSTLRLLKNNGGSTNA